MEFLRRLIRRRNSVAPRTPLQLDYEDGTIIVSDPGGDFNLRLNCSEIEEVWVEESRSFLGGVNSYIFVMREGNSFLIHETDNGIESIAQSLSRDFGINLDFKLARERRLLYKRPT